MQKTALKFIWNYLKEFKFILIFIFAMVIVARIFSQAGIYLIATIFDFAASNEVSPHYWRFLLEMILFCFAFEGGGILFQTLGMWFSSRLIPHLRSIVIKDVFDYVNKHSISYFTNEMAGNISNKFNQLQNGMVEFFMQSGNILFDFCYLLVNLFILAWMSWILGAVIFLWSIAVFFIGRYFGRQRAALSKHTSTQQSRSNAMIVDSIANYSEIKSFANYKYERLNLLKNLRSWRHAESREQRQKVFINLCLHLTASISGVFFMFLSLGLLYWRQIDVTGFIFILTVFSRLSGMVFGVNWSFNNMSRIIGQMDSALETISIEPDIVDLPKSIEFKSKKASLSFENIGFAYNARQPIFQNFSLEIKPGEKVGIVGSSGAGKSTLIKLIARYFDVKSGAIKINGTDIRTITQESLHKHIAIIPQDVCLFNRTLAENIRYGKTDASFAEIAKAARQASADKFIEKFPDKYNTKVGDRGVILSGGERQRIAIARAILKNAPVLIFDEATSSLDSESEKYIQASLKTLMKNKTVVAIAHRLSTLREMDRIIVLENGQVVEQGTHLGLLRKKGRYAKLFKMQSDGYLQTA